jgi:tetratricopeptide (TPR) repeat protein
LFFEGFMVFELNLNRPRRRLALAILALAVSSLLVVLIISMFVIGTLADDRLLVTRDTLQAPVGYFPNSARLNARMASAELSESDRDLANAKAHARRAIDLSPHDYRFRITLASIEEAEGDRSAAEASLQAARALAPNYWDVHYRLGNLFVREGKLAQSLDEFRIAVAANNALLPGTLDLLWRASRGDVNALQTAAGASPKARLTLAQFLLRVSRPAEAESVFGSIDREARLAASVESAAFLNALIAAGELEPARDFWSDLAGADRQSTLVWNGGFEMDLLKNFAQFDWLFGRSEYARLTIDGAAAHSGSRSLKIEFAGRDTTQLDNEIKQLVPVRPGVRYTLECYAKTSELETPEGPRVVVANSASPVWIAASEPVSGGSGDWRRLAVDFVAPQSVSGGMSAVFVSIKRKPKFSYDEPTRGTVWFDDFSLKEQ